MSVGLQVFADLTKKSFPGCLLVPPYFSTGSYHSRYKKEHRDTHKSHMGTDTTPWEK